MGSSWSGLLHSWLETKTKWWRANCSSPAATVERCPGGYPLARTPSGILSKIPSYKQRLGWDSKGVPRSPFISSNRWTSLGESCFQVQMPANKQLSRALRGPATELAASFLVQRGRAMLSLVLCTFSWGGFFPGRRGVADVHELSEGEIVWRLFLLETQPSWPYLPLVREASAQELVEPDELMARGSHLSCELVWEHFAVPFSKNSLENEYRISSWLRKPDTWTWQDFVRGW